MKGIYMIENLVDHKKYIGQTINYNRRLYLHLHYLRNGIHVNKHLQRAWDKYGESNFRFNLFHDLTTELEGLSREEEKKLLDDYEISWIKFYKSSNSDFGYNLSEGGDGAILLGERNPMYGKHRDETVKHKISTTLRTNKSHAGEKNGRFGKPVSDEVREKISNANSGRVQSEEERRMRSHAMRAANMKPENIAKREARKNDHARKKRYAELGKARRKYTDEFVEQIRSEYTTDADIKTIADKYNLRYKLVMEIVHRNGHFANR